MKRLFIILSIILLINSYYANSQIEYSVDKWMEYVEELALETEDTERIESLYADLSYLTEHPFDLNVVTEEQLKRLPFLSDRQIERLLSYRKRYGNMVSIYELKNIEDIDFQTISLLLPFVYIGDNLVEKRLLTVKNLLKYGRNELQIRYDQCFQQKRDMVNKRTAYFRYIRIVNIEENLSITPYVIPILSRIVYKQAS